MKKTIYIITAAIAIAFAGCKKEGCTDSTARNYNEKAKKDDGSCEIVGCMDALSTNYNADANIDAGNCEYPDASATILFSHVVDGNTLEFNNIKYLSKKGNEYSVENLYYFVSDIIVHGSLGDVSLNEAYYVDGETSSTLSHLATTKLPADTYTGITMVFGLEGDKNASGTYPNAPESNMAWPTMMGGGYHFMKLEGKYDSLNVGIVTKTYATHIGTTGGTSYAFSVDLDKSFTIQGETSVELVIEMDINKWYQDPNTYDFNDFDSGIMGNASAQQLLNANGKNNVFSLATVNVK